MNLLFLDTETGGTTMDVSLLTICLTVYTFTKDSILKHAELSLMCRPDNDVYHVNPDALAVNKIDLINHKAQSVRYKEAGTMVYNFLMQLNKDLDSKPVLVGQKVGFDLEHLFNSKVISQASWESLVDIRVIDTLGIAQFAVLCGLIPRSQSLSLRNLAKFLKIEIEEDRLHTADYDNELTAKVLFEFRTLFK